ncbi:MAG: flippase-like domain-containing protein [Candidatus Nanopelagicales bacterium]
MTEQKQARPADPAAASPPAGHPPHAEAHAGHPRHGSEPPDHPRYAPDPPAAAAAATHEPGSSGPPANPFALIAPPSEPGSRVTAQTLPGAPPGEGRPAGQATLVVEEGEFRSRLRRPRDLGGALLALLSALFVVAVAMTAQETTRALDSDLEAGQRILPDFIWGALGSVAGLGLVLLPLASAISLLIRRRGRQLLEAIGAMTATAIVLTLASTLIRDYGEDSLYVALTGSPPGSGLAYPTNPMLGGLVAFVTVARLMSRSRWNVLTSVVVISAALVSTVAGSSTAAAQGLSILVGLAIGLLVRYTLGTPTTRPSGTDVATTLINAGIPLVMLRASGGTDSGRRYMAVTQSGDQLDVVVLDRDLEGSGLASTLWRAIRVREADDPTSGLSMRNQLDRAAMMGYAAEAAGVPTPRLELAAQVGADAALLAYRPREGRVVIPGARTQSDLPSHEELDMAWGALGGMQRQFLAHQQLHARNIRYAGADTHLVGLDSGTVAASDVALRLDIAELLVTQSLQTDVESAVASARRVLGDEAVLRGLPVLQRVAMSGPTRSALRGRKQLLNDLRAELLTINPRVDVQPIDLERLKPRTLVTMMLGTVAGYLLLSQLASVSLSEVLAQADWLWAGVALALSLLTYVGATLSVSGFVPDRLSFGRTLQAQFAASFATLVSPPTLGAVAVNARYLNRAGLPAPAAAATIGVSQVAAFVVHVTLMLIVAIAAGTQADLQFNPPRGAIIGIGIAAMIIGGLASISHVRTWLSHRIRPMVEQVIPRLVTVAQRPVKLVEGFGGILLLNVAYCLCLVVAVRAFSDSLTIAAISFVYLAGSTLGQAAPTPGGLGVVEAAIAAGLTAAGLDSGLAVSATLLFRLVTFWLPTVPGWFAFRDLTRRNLL